MISENIRQAGRECARIARRWANLLFYRRLRVFLIDRRIDKSRAQYHRARKTVIEQAWRAAGPGFVLIAGDSHAEMLGKPDPGPSVVNAGLGGIRTREYADYIDTIAGSPRASVAVLFIGTNDTLAIHKPLAHASRRAFETAARRAVRRLMQLAACVIVSRIPPVRRSTQAFLQLDAITAYSESLRRICGEEGCLFLDPFASMRTSEDSIIQDCVAMDAVGMHLADYGLLEQEILAILSAHLR